MKKYLTKAIPMPDGSRKYVRATTKAELEKKVRQIQIQLDEGLDLSSKMTFGEVAQVWYECYKEPYLKDRSKTSIKYIVNYYILPILGDKLPRDITPLQIQQLMLRLGDKSHSLQAKVLVYLRDIFKVAVESHLILSSPVSDRTRAGGTPTKERVPLTPDEVSHLLNAVTNPRAHLFLLLCLSTGARQGEALALSYSDIDLDKRVIHLCHNAIVEEGRTEIVPDMKTKAGCRDIPIPDDLYAELLAQPSKTGYLFSMKNGEPLTRSAYRSMFRLISRELPDKRVSSHILRHTYITRLFEIGLDLKEIQYLAGHSKIEMTLNVYTHYDRLSRGQQTASKVISSLKFSAPVQQSCNNL